MCAHWRDGDGLGLKKGDARYSMRREVAPGVPGCNLDHLVGVGLIWLKFDPHAPTQGRQSQLTELCAIVYLYIYTSSRIYM